MERQHWPGDQEIGRRRRGNEHTNSDHQNLAWPCHVDDAVGILEDLDHHLLLVLGGGLVLGMRAGMNDAVHVQVEVVKLLAIGIRLRGVDGDHGAIVHLDWEILQDRRDNLGVFGGEPPEGGGNTHLVEGGVLGK